MQESIKLQKLKCIFCSSHHSFLSVQKNQNEELVPPETENFQAKNQLAQKLILRMKVNKQRKCEEFQKGIPEKQHGRRWASPVTVFLRMVDQFF